MDVIAGEAKKEGRPGSTSGRDLPERETTSQSTATDTGKLSNSQNGDKAGTEKDSTYVAWLTGVPVASIILSGFGAWWIAGAFQSIILRQGVYFALVVGVTLIAMSIYSFITGRRLLKSIGLDVGRLWTGSLRRNFAITSFAEFFLIFIVVLVFPRLHLQDFIFAAVSVIVGIHFFPLGRIFRVQRYYATGAIMVIWTAWAVLSLSKFEDILAVGLVNGSILWANAVAGLYTSAMKRRNFMPAQ
ncbi:MAG: hypothetical protein JRN68_11260 [Nitrososphaerota archaeon]|nr:hypothetical protein [Nitrososphaerota archaeon]